MRFIIKSNFDLLKRSDVKYNLGQSRKILESSKIKDLQEKVVRDPMCYGFQYCNEGIPLIRISDLRQPFIDYTNVAYISKDIHSKFHKTQLEKMDILMSVRGVSIGKVGIFLGEFPEANISPNIIIIRLKNKEIAPYVCMVLLSKVGQEQIARIIAGSSKPTITAPLINLIQIPMGDKAIIKDVCKHFWAAFKIKNDAVIKEEDSLLEFKKEFFSYESNLELTNVKNLFKEQRWDPHFHNPRYENLRKGLEVVKCYKLSELCSHLDQVVDYKTSQEKIGYIEISSINNLNAQIEEIKIDYIKKLPHGGKIPLKDKCILIPKVRPYRNANTIFKDDKKVLYTASKNAFSVYATDTYKYPYYILAFLRSYYGVNQIVMRQSGTSYPTVSDEDIQSIKIPMLKEDIIKKINENYEYYIQSRQEELRILQRITQLIDSTFV